MEERKDILADIFLEKLETTPFKQIRIESMIELTGFNYRSAFYRCFKDKYELLQYTLKRKIKKTCDEAIIQDNYKDMVVELIADYVTINRKVIHETTIYEYQKYMKPVYRYLIGNLLRVVGAKRNTKFTATEKMVSGMCLFGICSGMIWYDGKIGFNSNDNPIRFWLEYSINNNAISESSLNNELINTIESIE